MRITYESGLLSFTEPLPEDIANAILLCVRKSVEVEREACAKIVEEEGDCRHVDHVQGFCACADKAAAIRARGKE